MHFTTYLAAGAFAAVAQAQTFTNCNPMEKQCPNDPAMAATFDTDFRKGAANVKGWKQTAGALTYNGEGAQFTVGKQGDAPTIQSEGYLHFGYVEVKMKSAPGTGIVSSIVVQSENLDETDWEFLGGVNDKVQMNYFGKGNTTTYDRMKENPVPNVQGQMHTYALNWTAEAMTWIIDGKAVRTLKYAEANGGKNFPQTPSTVRIGIWAGGDPNNEKGVIEWAGGKTDYTKAPYSMTVESVKVINYSPGKEYQWTDKSGDFKSIKVIEPGNKAGAPQNSAVLQPSAAVSGGGIKPTPGGPGPVPSGSCNCGVATVTITGPPPAGTPTGAVPPPPPPPASSKPNPPPPAGTPPPTGTTGLIKETNPPPVPSKPVSAAPPPGSNATTSTIPPEFTGAANSNRAGALLGVAAGALMLAI